jgi:hypothetical protein
VVYYSVHILYCFSIRRHFIIYDFNAKAGKCCRMSLNKRVLEKKNTKVSQGCDILASALRPTRDRDLGVSCVIQGEGAKIPLIFTPPPPCERPFSFCTRYNYCIVLPGSILGPLLFYYTYIYIFYDYK